MTIQTKIKAPHQAGFAECLDLLQAKSLEDLIATDRVGQRKGVVYSRGVEMLRKHSMYVYRTKTCVVVEYLDGQ